MNNYNFRNRDGSTPLDKEQLEGIKFSHVTLMRELDELEDENIQRGLDWLRRNKSENYLSIEFLNELHKKLFGDVWKWAGVFRKKEVNLSNTRPHDIGPKLKNLFADVKIQITMKSMPWEEIVTEFHHKLVSIHPYPNGNGRVSRIMTEYLEKRNTQKVTSWMVSLKADPQERRKKYIESIRLADKGDYTLLKKFIEEKIS